MNTFRSIEELVRMLDKEKLLLKDMFAKRKLFSFQYDYALAMTEYKEERIRYLIDYGVIRDMGDFLEMEDIYLKFFEDVLEVNEEINVSFVQDYITRLNETIDYYLKETNEHRKCNYQQEVRRCLKNIALATVKNVMDLKRNMDNTYKNEPNYQIKKTKLAHLDEKRNNIALLIRACEEVVDNQQPTFFRLAMDVQMRRVVGDVKLQLNDSYHNLLEIQKQIIHYLNLIDYQNHILMKVRQLKYLKDQFLLTESCDIRQVANGTNPVWMEPQAGYRLKLSVDYLRASDEAFDVIKKIMARMKNPKGGPKLLAEAIPEDYLDRQSEVIEVVSLQEIKNAFVASSNHLFDFVMGFRYRMEVSRDQKLIYFCQLASQYADELLFTEQYQTTGDVEYPLIYAK